MLARKLIEAAAVPTGEAAEAIDFDGTNDYLSRTSDLTGNADGKTFTFSAWVWWDGSNTSFLGLFGINDSQVKFYFDNGTLNLYAIDTSATQCLGATSPANSIRQYTWSHILVSVDMSGGTTKRRVYINDELISMSWSSFVDASIDWTVGNLGVGAVGSAGPWKVKGRLSNVFLAYEYVDLSVEANRRIFITADRKPA